MTEWNTVPGLSRSWGSQVTSDQTEDGRAMRVAAAFLVGTMACAKASEEKGEPYLFLRLDAEGERAKRRQQGRTLQDSGPTVMEMVNFKTRAQKRLNETCRTGFL